MAKKKATLDRSRPFATISSLKPQEAVYEQEGILFGQDGRECGRVEGYDERRAQERANAAKKKAAEKAPAAVDEADQILADLGADIAGDAARENQAAAEAEKLADDA